ncbi:transmembrane emp24 domain-containing protein, putative [Hepatocystis sp. ex Piliocolobus tephrosceles]|nr:transmembrane emp24 domain-containing protein, putative [Hepatocystis sp. ex Piliocolobus tephrosceles]VWU52568.1 transmembrane emp24 domain-containing protein, putative [Hepatocystis sp. ex Piliocolobus tephrosceles]
MTFFKTFILLFFFYVCCHLTTCTHFTIKPFERDCFHMSVNKHNVIAGSYDIIERYAYVSISILTINNKKKDIFFKSDKNQDKFEVKVEKAGLYYFCYDNKRNNEITLMFTLRIQEGSNAEDSEFSTVDDMEKITFKSSKLYYQFLDVVDEQERILEKADVYKQANDKMNYKLIVWSEIEIIILIILTLVHIYYIKSFFEIKTIV